MQTRTKESKKRLHSLILLIAFTAVLLIVSTYAWFTAQTDVNVSNIRGKVEVAEGLEISLDGGSWTQVIDLGDTEHVSLTTPKASGNNILYGPNSADDNIVPAEFLPVSTSGEVAVADGKKSDVMTMYTGTYSGDVLTAVQTCNEANDNGYFAFDLYLKDTSKASNDASGNPITEKTLQLNSDSWAWVLPDNNPIGSYEGDPETGLQNTVRVAFAKYGHANIPASADKTLVQETLSNETNDGGIQQIAIWEPNAKYHTSYTVIRIGEAFTNAMNTNNILTAVDSLFFTRTLKSAALTVPADGIQVYNWGESYAAQYFSIPYTVQTGYDADWVANGTNTGFSPYIEGVTNLTDITATGDSAVEFKFPVNSITKYRVYVWMEGQDPDCHNNASLGGGIEVNIGLIKDATVGNTTKKENIKSGKANNLSSSFTNGIANNPVVVNN